MASAHAPKRFHRMRREPSRNALPFNPPPSVAVRSTIPGFPGMVRVDMVAKADAKAHKPKVQPEPPEPAAPPAAPPEETQPVSCKATSEPRFGGRLGRLKT